MDAALFGLALSSACLHALWNFAAKKASGRLDVVYLGMGIAAVVLLPAWSALSHPLEGKDYYYIGMTGLLQASYFLTIAGAYRVGEISVVYPIARGFGILVTAAIGVTFAGETISGVGGIGILAIVAGTMVLGFHELRRGQGGHAVGLALLTGLAAGGSYLYGKLAVARVPPVFYVWSLAASTVVLLAPYCLVGRRAELAQAWRHFRWHAAVIGLGSMTSYLIALCAFQRGPISYVVPVRECSVVFGTALGVCFLGERLTRRKVLAVGAIALGAVLLKLA